MREILTFYFGTAVFIAGINFFSLMYYAMKAMYHRKPGVPLFQTTFRTPVYVLWRPELLTEAGLKARKWYFIHLIIFFCMLAIGGILATISEATR